MLDGAIRRRIDPWLDLGGRALARAGASANAVTIAGFALGMLAAATIFLEAPALLTLAVFGVSRLCDGLDGAVAKVRGRSDLGGFLDIVLDFSFYGAVPLAFALQNPAANALPAAVLLFAFYVNGTTFLAFAAIAAKRGADHPTLRTKSLVFSAGLAEATETIAVLAAMIVWPAHFALLAYIFAGLCLLSATARVALAAATFRQ